MARAILGDGCGFVISDRYGSYDWLQGSQRQLCLAHILRDFTRMAQRNNKISMVGKRLVVSLREIFKLWHQWLALPDPEKVDFAMTPKFVAWQNSIKLLLLRGSSSDCKKSAGTCRKILDKFDCMWIFAKYRDTGIAPTNNYAERVLLPAVIYKTLCFGIDSLQGIRFI
jgi:transposase